MIDVFAIFRAPGGGRENPLASLQTECIPRLQVEVTNLYLVAEKKLLVAQMRAPDIEAARILFRPLRDKPVTLWSAIPVASLPDNVLPDVEYHLALPDGNSGPASPSHYLSLDDRRVLTVAPANSESETRPLSPPAIQHHWRCKRLPLPLDSGQLFNRRPEQSRRLFQTNQRRITMKLFTIRRRNAWKNAGELEATAGRSAAIGNNEMADKVRWIRSYVVTEDDGTLGTVCIYEAVDDAAIREHARRVGMPADDIRPVADTVVIRPDPVSADSAA